MLSIFKNRFLFCICALTFLLCYSSCSVTKFLSEDEILFNDNKVTIINKSEIEIEPTLKRELEAILLPKNKNAKLRLRNHFKYQNAEKKIGKWIFKRLSEAPIFFEEEIQELSKERMKTYLFSKGYFNSEISSAYVVKDKFAYVEYRIKLQPAYLFGKIEYPPASDDIGKLINLTKYESEVQPNEKFDLEKLNKERNRISQYLKEIGYFRFNKDFIQFDLDSTSTKGKVDVYYKIKPFLNGAQHKKSTIRNITVFENLPANANLSDPKFTKIESNKTAYYYLDKVINPEIVLDKIELVSDSVYNLKKHKETISKLLNIGMYKFVDVSFIPTESNNFDSLDVLVRLATKNPIEFELDAEVNSKNDIFQTENIGTDNSFNLGTALSLTHSNLNTFGNAERLTINLFGGLENQFSDNGIEVNAIDINGSIGLLIPKLLLPGFSKRKFEETPKTIVRVGSNYLQRLDYYTLSSINANFGYQWRVDKKRLHSLNLASLSYLRLLNTTEEFDFVLNNNLSLLKSFEEQIIPALTYTFEYNTLPNELAKNSYFYRISLESAGNLFNAFGSNNETTNNFLGVRISQFLKFDSKFQYYRKFNKNNILATRVKGGIGFAYGNSDVLPYSKQYFSGGTNGIRAFRIRTLGPGAYLRNSTSDDIFIDQTGDLNFEVNVEYRYKPISFLETAFFIDAGNIWTIREESNKPNGQFAFNTFYKEIAVGTGIGARLDFTYFLIRLDAAFPIRIPWLAENERWVLNKVNPFDSIWRNDFLVLNLAIGHPF